MFASWIGACDMGSVSHTTCTGSDHVHVRRNGLACKSIICLWAWWTYDMFISLSTLIWQAIVSICMKLLVPHVKKNGSACKHMICSWAWRTYDMFISSWTHDLHTDRLARKHRYDVFVSTANTQYVHQFVHTYLGSNICMNLLKVKKNRSAHKHGEHMISSSVH